MNRIAGLDGLRAVSILLVLSSHLVGTRGFPVGAEAATRLGALGVQMFFVISGFLITTLLVKERAKTGTISLPMFYARRTLRLAPALLVYVAFVAALHFTGVIALRPRDLLHSLTYTMNYHFDRSWEVGHLWSLAVEEQFYLIWPAAMYWCATRGQALKTIAVVIAAGPFLRVGLYLLNRQWSIASDQLFPTVADQLAVGCALALLADNISANALWRKLSAASWFVLIPLSGIAVKYVPSVMFGWVVGQTYTSVAFGLTVLWATQVKGTAGRILNQAIIVYVGFLSYSLYVWQQYFLDKKCPTALHAWPFNLVCAVVAAMASYHLVEVPMLRVRDRLLRPRTPGQPRIFAGSA